MKDLIFDYQSKLHYFAATATDAELEFFLADLVSENLTVKKENFLASLQDPEMDWLARVDWKFGCSLGVSGTPFPFINRVFFDGGDYGIMHFTIDDWKHVIDPLLRTGKKLVF